MSKLNDATHGLLQSACPRIAEKVILKTLPLDGLKILILEDEFLIAMDVEQLCRDHGAQEVVISRTLDDLGADQWHAFDYDAAVVDMRLGGTTTLDFARRLFERGVPFVFATGYSDSDETSRSFPGVPVITKPYLGEELIGALADAVQTRSRAVG